MAWTILVVDDSRTIRESVRMTFLNTEFRVEQAATGEEGLAKAATLRPNLILADAFMPGMDGYAFCQNLKSVPQTAGIPVLLLIGQQRPSDMPRSKAVGAQGFFQKPFDSQDLIDQATMLVSSRPAAAPAQLTTEEVWEELEGAGLIRTAQIVAGAKADGAQAEMELPSLGEAQTGDEEDLIPIGDFDETPSEAAGEPAPAASQPKELSDEEAALLLEEIGEEEEGESTIEAAERAVVERRQVEQIFSGEKSEIERLRRMTLEQVLAEEEVFEKVETKREPTGISGKTGDRPLESAGIEEESLLDEAEEAPLDEVVEQAIEEDVFGMEEEFAKPPEEEQPAQTVAAAESETLPEVADADIIHLDEDEEIELPAGEAAPTAKSFTDEPITISEDIFALADAATAESPSPARPAEIAADVEPPETFPMPEAEGETLPLEAADMYEEAMAEAEARDVFAPVDREVDRLLEIESAPAMPTMDEARRSDMLARTDAVEEETAEPAEAARPEALKPVDAAPVAEEIFVVVHDQPARIPEEEKKLAPQGLPSSDEILSLFRRAIREEVATLYARSAAGLSPDVERLMRDVVRQEVRVLLVELEGAPASRTEAEGRLPPMDQAEFIAAIRQAMRHEVHDSIIDIVRDAIGRLALDLPQGAPMMERTMLADIVGKVVGTEIANGLATLPKPPDPILPPAAKEVAEAVVEEI
ncbi:MAG: response regulator, partial [Myxococcales bacterium]